MLLEELNEIIGSSGELAATYGGYTILVKDEDFRFYQVFKKLLSLGLDVWIIESDGQLKIVSKPRAE